MIHEGPLLEYAGRDLAYLQWAAAARHWVVLVLACRALPARTARPFAGAARRCSPPALVVALRCCSRLVETSAGEDAHPARAALHRPGVPRGARRRGLLDRGRGRVSGALVIAPRAGPRRHRRRGGARSRSRWSRRSRWRSALGALQLAEGRSGDYLVAALVLRREGDRAACAAGAASCDARASTRPIRAAAGPLRRGSRARCGLVLAAIALVPPLGLEDAARRARRRRAACSSASPSSWPAGPRSSSCSG